MFLSLLCKAIISKKKLPFKHEIPGKLRVCLRLRKSKTPAEAGVKAYLSKAGGTGLVISFRRRWRRESISGDLA